MEPIMITRIPHPRAGNALLMTIIVLAGVAAMMTLSSQRVLGMHVLAGFNLRNQAASSAAEAGASMVEGGLYATSGDNTTLTRDIATVPIQPNLNPWLSYMGYAGTGSWPNLWIGNCMIRWRLEPVTVYAQTYAGTPAAGTNFTYNYQANANLVGTPPANSLVNPGFYHYRIVSTAWYMDDLGKHKTSGGAALTMANATPWNNPEQALATAQVERLVELKIVNLFQYVIFYAATKETGDIEFHPGAYAQRDRRGAEQRLHLLRWRGHRLPDRQLPRLDLPGQPGNHRQQRQPGRHQRGRRHLSASARR